MSNTSQYNTIVCNLAAPQIFQNDHETELTPLKTLETKTQHYFPPESGLLHPSCRLLLCICSS